MIPERIASSIQKWFDKDYRATFYERIECLIESEPLYEGLPYPQRYGRTLEYTLDHISVFIRKDEKIVGSVKEQIPTPEQKERAEQLTKSWWTIAPEEIQKRILWFYSYGWLRRRPPWFHSFGHLALDWDGIITKGLGDFSRRARGRMTDGEIARDPDKLNFLEGVVISVDAIARYIRRHAAEAAREAAQCAERERRAELLAMSESLASLSEKPARTFHEALQLIWLVTLPLMKVAGCGVLNFSRIDQYLLPFYRRDIESGATSRREALELIEEFYNKNNEIMSPTDHMSQEIEAVQYNMEITYDDPNYLIVAGIRANGDSAVNELSHLFIEAAHEMRLRNPFIVVRYHQGIDEKFWLEVCDAVRDNATVVVYNDATIVPALQACGVAEKDAVDFGFYGCNDPNIPAMEGGLRQLWFNLARALELALHQGDYPLKPRGNAPREKRSENTQFSLEDRMIGLMTGAYYGKKTPAPAHMRSIDDLLDAFRAQVRFLLEDYRQAFEKDFRRELQYFHGKLRIEDCFLKGTIENATTWNNGGTKYHKVTVQGCGLATVADSLASIQELVFRKKEMSLPELVEVLRSDYAGSDELFSRLRNRMPAFGNDSEEVDNLAAKVVDIFCDETARQNEPHYVYSFFPTLSTDRDFTTMGKFVGATPNGRRAGEPISENQSPSQGRDIMGLTALLNSAARLPFHRITGGPLNIKLHPSVVRGENGLRMFAAALLTYFEKGGMQVQLNVVSREELVDAQKHPENHKSLCVRVVGYSAYFVQMGKQAQNELIERSEKR